MKSLLLLSLLAATLLNAQTTPPAPEIPRFTFSVSALGFDEAPELYWLDLQYDPYGKEIREYQRMDIGLGGRGSPAEIPVRPPLHLYRSVQAEDGSRHMEPLIPLPEQQKDGRLMLVFYRKTDGSTSFQFLDDSYTAHPAQTVRVVNFSNTNMAVTVGGPPVAVGPGKSELLGKPVFSEPGRFHFTFGVTLPDRGAWQAPTKNLRFRSVDNRLLILYTALPMMVEVTDESGRSTGHSQRVFEPTAYRMYDRVVLPAEPPPPSP